MFSLFLNLAIIYIASFAGLILFAAFVGLTHFTIQRILDWFYDKFQFSPASC